MAMACWSELLLWCSTRTTECLQWQVCLSTKSSSRLSEAGVLGLETFSISGGRGEGEEEQMLFYCAVKCLRTAKEPDTVWSWWVTAPSFSLGCSYIHGYFGTQRHHGAEIAALSNYHLLFSCWQCEPELNVPSTGKNSTRMLEVSLTDRAERLSWTPS